MGPIRKAFRWGKKRPDVGEVSSQLRVLSKQLARERNKLEKEARDTRARAVRARKEGRIDAYKTYAAEMVRFRRFALSVDKSRLQILKILAYITRAQTTAKANVALEKVADILGLLGDTTDTLKVVENVDEIGRRLEQFEIESSMSTEALDTTEIGEVTSEELATAMAEIDAEAGASTSRAKKAPMTESEELEAEIKSLEQELGV